MWELDCKESWAQKNWCFWTVVLEKTLKSPLDCKEIQPVHPEGNQSWMFIGKTDVEAETPVLWPPDAKRWLIWKVPDAGKDWRREEKGIDRGWDGWMASLTQWTWVWVNSRSWCWIGRPGVLLFMGSQRVSHDWMTTELNCIAIKYSQLNNCTLLCMGMPLFIFKEKLKSLGVDYRYFQMSQHNNISIYHMERERKLAKC